MPQDKKVTWEELKGLGLVWPDEEEEELLPTTTSNWPQRAGALGIRVGGGLLSGLIGAVPSPLTTGSAMAIGGAAETAAQFVEAPSKPFSKSKILAEAGISGVPFSKVYKYGAPLARNVLRGAGLGVGSNWLRRGVDAEGNPLPTDMNDVAWDVAGGAIGGAAGLLGRAKNAVAATGVGSRGSLGSAGVDAGKIDPATGRKVFTATVPGPNVAAEWTSPHILESIMERSMRPTGDRLAKSIGREAVQAAARTRATVDMPSLREPLAPSGAAQANIVRTGLTEDIGRRAASFDPTEAGVVRPRTRSLPLFRPGEVTDITEQALEKLRAAGSSPRRLAARGLRLRETTKEATQESRNLNARDKFVEKAAELEEAKKVRDAAQARMDELLNSDNLVVSPPVISDTTVSVPTATGKQTLRQTIREKPPEVDGEGGGGGGDGLLRDPSPTNKVVLKVPPARPDRVTPESRFVSEREAKEALRLSGLVGHHVEPVNPNSFIFRIMPDAPAVEGATAKAVTPTPPPPEPPAPAAPVVVPPKPAPQGGAPAAVPPVTPATPNPTITRRIHKPVDTDAAYLAQARSWSDDELKQGFNRFGGDNPDSGLGRAIKTVIEERAAAKTGTPAPATPIVPKAPIVEPGPPVVPKAVEPVAPKLVTPKPVEPVKPAAPKAPKPATPSGPPKNLPEGAISFIDKNGRQRYAVQYKDGTQNYRVHDSKGRYIWSDSAKGIKNIHNVDLDTLAKNKVPTVAPKVETSTAAAPKAEAPSTPAAPPLKPLTELEKWGELVSKYDKRNSIDLHAQLKSLRASGSHPDDARAIETILRRRGETVKPAVVTKVEPPKSVVPVKSELTPNPSPNYKMVPLEKGKWGIRDNKTNQIIYKSKNKDDVTNKLERIAKEETTPTVGKRDEPSASAKPAEKLGGQGPETYPYRGTKMGVEEKSPPIRGPKEPPTPPAEPVPVPVKPKPKSPDSSAGAEALAPTVLSTEQRFPKGTGIHAYSSDGEVLTTGPFGVRVKFTSGRMVKEQGTKGYFDVDPKHIDESIRPNKVEASTTKGFEGPDRVVETPGPKVTERGPFEKMAENARVPSSAVKVDLAGAVDAPEVHRRVINELEGYKKQVDAAEATKGVDEKGVYTYGTPIPKPLILHVPGGPTLTVKPDQVNAAIAQLEKEGSKPWRGIVDDIARPTSFSVSTGYGSNFNAKGGSAPPVKFPIGPSKGAAPIAKAAAKAEPLKPAVAATIKSWSDKELASAKDALMPGDPIITAAEKELATRLAKDAASKAPAQTVTQKFNEHIGLASKWLEYNNRKITEANISKIMEKNTVDELRTMLSKRNVAEVPKGKVTLKVPPAEPPKVAIPNVEAPKIETVLAKPDLDDLRTKAEAANKAWGDLKDQQKAGKEVTKEQLDVAGEALGRANWELKFAQMTPDEQAAVLLKRAAKGKKPPVSEPSSDDLAKMTPEEQSKALTDIVNKLKKKGRKFDETGAGVNELALSMGFGAAGALAGAAANPEDPITGALMGGIGGVSATVALRAAINHTLNNPNLSASARNKSNKLIADKMNETVRSYGWMFPQYYRASLLSNPINLTINAVVGPYGSGLMAAMEHAIAGDVRGIKAVKEFLNPINFPTQYYQSYKPAGKLIASTSERTEGAMINAGPEWFKTATGFPAQVLTAGDEASRRLLMKSGFSEDEARTIVLTSEPFTGFGRGIGRLRGTVGANNKQSIGMHLLLPFWRTNVNQLEQGLIRLPFVGPILDKVWRDTPIVTRQQFAKQFMSGSVIGTAYVLGSMTPKENARYAVKAVNNFGGQYGSMAGLAFLAGQASRDGKTPIQQVIAVGNGAIQQNWPLPTADVARDILRTAKQVSESKPKDLLDKASLPYGIIPPFLSSKSEASIPGLMSGKWQATEQEYSIFAPFKKGLKIKKGPKELTPGQKAVAAYKARIKKAKEERGE